MFHMKITSDHCFEFFCTLGNHLIGNTRKLGKGGIGFTCKNLQCFKNGFKFLAFPQGMSWIFGPCLAPCIV